VGRPSGPNVAHIGANINNLAGKIGAEVAVIAVYFCSERVKSQYSGRAFWKGS